MDNPEKIGRYEVEEELGRGGMAVVFLARDPFMSRLVAVKLMPRFLTFDEQFKIRFQQEAQIIASLEHPAIVPVYDFGYVEELPFIVMRFMPGGSLEDRLKKGPLSIAETNRILRQLAPAIDRAHHQGVIHRDLKPGNILFDENNNAYVSDFGIAKISEASVALTGSGTVGTPAYMSPEQALGKKELDGRSDVYAMGVILFEMLSGELPYMRTTPMSVALAHINDPIPDILEKRPGLPETLEAIINRALAKDKKDRFRTAVEFVDSLPSSEKSKREFSDSEQFERLTKAPTAYPGLDEHLDKLYDEGLSAYWLEDWEKARDIFQEIVNLRPDYQDAGQKVEVTKRRLQQEALYERGEAAMDALDWASALAAFEQLVALSPNFRDAPERLEKARQEIRLAELYNEAHRLHDSGRWKAVVNVFAQIESIKEDYQDPDSLLSVATAALREEERNAFLEDLYRQALRALDSGLLEQAEELLEKVREERSGFRDTEKLLERIAEKWDRDMGVSRVGRDVEEPIQTEPGFQQSTMVTGEQRTPLYQRLGVPVWGLGAGIIFVVMLGCIGAWGLASWLFPASIRFPLFALAQRPTPSPTSSPTQVPSPTMNFTPTRQSEKLLSSGESSQTPTSLPTSSPTLTPSTQPTSTNSPTPMPVAVVTFSSLALRAGPGTAYPILDSYEEGTELSILGKEPSDDWFNVIGPDGQMGWMWGGYLEFNIDVSDIEVVDITPTPPPTQRASPTPTAEKKPGKSGDDGSSSDKPTAAPPDTPAPP